MRLFVKLLNSHLCCQHLTNAYNIKNCDKEEWIVIKLFRCLVQGYISIQGCPAFAQFSFFGDMFRTKAILRALFRNQSNIYDGALL